MIMSKLRYVLLMLAICALTACRKEKPEVVNPQEGPDRVRIHVTVGELASRSNPAGDASEVTLFSSGDNLSVKTDDQGPVIYTFDGSLWTTGEGEDLLWNKEKYTFTAFHPATYTGTEEVSADQSSEKLIAANDFMKFKGELAKQESVNLAMERQNARIVIDGDFNWNSQYMDGDKPRYKVTDVRINSGSANDIKPYRSDDYYALVNPCAAAPDAAFVILTFEPLAGGSPITQTLNGIPALEAGYSYKIKLSISGDGVSLDNVTVDEWGTGGVLEGSADNNFEHAFFFREEIKELDFSYAGGSGNLEIVSYVRMGNTSVVPLPWTASFVRKLQNGTYEEIKQGEADYPTWISEFTDKGIGDAIDNLCTVIVAPSEIRNNHYDVLKNAEPVSGIYNLSNSTGGEAVENTANCYIVNAAGSYSLPLVYGNAIKNGTKNESSYKSSASGKNALENFVNHRNAPISSPYIAAHSDCVPDNAVLVWQDAENLVSNIKFVDGGSPEAHRVTFDVEQSTIKQGNAIIAVRDANNIILWSWHIWVTDYKPGLDAVKMTSYDPSQTQRDRQVWNFDNKYSYTFMGVPLGWCDAETTAGNEAIIQFTQTDSGETLELTIKQEPLAVGGNCTFYQWGRKDPMLGSNGLSNVDKAHFGGLEYSFTKDGPGKVSVGTAIQNPHIYYNYGGSGYFDWCSNSETIEGKNFLFNLWDTHNTSLGYKGFIKYAIATKTVYDPSPVGYVVPPNGAMNGLTCDGKNEGDGWGYRNKYNTPFASSEELNAVNGWLFYCRGMNGKQGNWDASAGVIYHPAVGYREFDYKGSLNDVGVLCQYWSSVPYTDAIACTAAFNVATVTVLSDGATYRIHGEPVRPIREY